MVKFSLLFLQVCLVILCCKMGDELYPVFDGGCGIFVAKSSSSLAW